MVRRDDRDFETLAAGAIAWPACLVRAEASVVRRAPWVPRIYPVVDLGDAIGSARWCRGVATLGAMLAALIWVAPRIDRLPDIARRAPYYAIPVAPVATPSVAPMPYHPDTRPPISDGAPVRLAGTVSGGLYRSLLDAGAPPAVAAEFIRAIGTRFDVGTIVRGDRFDIVVAHGKLVYAGILHDGQPLGLMRWTLAGREQWLDAAGTGAPSDGFIVPVADARLSSGFGMRFHPILGFSRMHQGIDLAAPAGTPIMAAAEGIVRFAAGHGGYGNFVQVQHNGGMGSGYGHMSAIAVQPGEMVRQGQLLGYVGSTGLSTGPHCHFEIYRDGVAIDPTTANQAVAAQLGGEELAQFRIALARVMAVPVAR